MTIISALISQCRREYGDNPKSVSLSRQGNGSVNVFSVGKYKPVLESSYTVYVSGVAKTETTHYTFDLDNGEINTVTTPANGVEVRSDHKFAFWRDKNWVEAINQGISQMNARGFFKQVVRNPSVFRLSANVQVYNGPSACIDLYELLVSNNNTTSGSFSKPNVNWSYQRDGNKIILGNKPTTANRAQVSYLRKMQTYSATSATVDVLDEWEEQVKKAAGAAFYRSLAGKIAKEGNANIDEGHFSFTNLRTMANDLQAEFDKWCIRNKPPLPAKDIGYNDPNGGVAN